MEFEVKKEFPPNIEQIKSAIGITEEQIIQNNVVFSYGIALYNPTGKPIPHHLIVHEKVHQKQQLEIGVEKWWTQYLEDKDFRLEQEIEAYATQYQFIREKTNNKISKDFLTQITLDLCNYYGFDLDYGIIESKIRNYKLI